MNYLFFLVTARHEDLQELGNGKDIWKAIVDDNLFEGRVITVKVGAQIIPLESFFDSNSFQKL